MEVDTFISPALILKAPSPELWSETSAEMLVTMRELVGECCIAGSQVFARLHQTSHEGARTCLAVTLESAQIKRPVFVHF